MSIFREYDIRGIADRDLDNVTIWALGFSLGSLAKAQGENRCYIGRDVRLSSPRLARALASGAEAAGLEVRLLSPGPTPLLYFCTHQPEPDFQTRTGFMITGSHNPGEYNGCKMVLAGKTLHGSDIQELRSLVESHRGRAPQEPTCRAIEVNREQAYVDYVASTVKLKRKLKVVVDGGNGAGGLLGVKTYRALGADVVPLFCEPDGSFPNHHPDPTVPKNLVHLIKAVKESRADLGIAFDGDGDRIGAVSSSGQILFGDHLVLYYSRDILEKSPQATIISEVKSSQVLYDTLAKWGARPIMWKTGHSLIKAKLKETGAQLAGEMSGHMFFADRFFGFDDGIYSGARLMEGLSARNETLDQFLDGLPPMINTPELRVDCADDKKFDVVRRFLDISKKRYGVAVNDIDGARVKFQNGWGLLRASNTQPVLVLRFESVDSNGLQQIRQNFVDILQSIDPEVVVPEIR